MNDVLENTIIHELRARHIGAKAQGKSPGSVPRLYIFDLKGMFLSAGALRSTLDKMGTDVFYRGQRRDWDLCPSIYRDINKPMKRDKLGEKNKKIEKILEDIKG